MSKREKQVYQELREAFEPSYSNLCEKVVYCMDCKFSRVINSSRYPAKFIGKRYCIQWGDGMQGDWVPDKGFCHNGELKVEYDE